jgi:beta-fructofuranosidase
MINSIRNAETFIQEHKDNVDPAFRPIYHPAAPCGWINDPNGFCYFAGQYHLFFQYNPYSSIWDTMHWGHWTSDDLVRWRWSGVALAPDMPYDKDGCFSGHAIVKDETLYLFYTGVYTDEKGNQRQEQCFAQSKDGVHFTKYESNPVITAEQLPEGAAVADFRDPKPYCWGDRFRLLVASRGELGGDILMYESKDLIHWHYVKKHIEGMCLMLECPDYFDLDGHTVTVVSTIEMPEDGLKYPGKQPVLGMIDVEKNGSCGVSLDFGFDFYAAQSMQTPDGRRIMIGWMFNGPDDFPPRYLGHNWNNMMTIPRELTIDGGQILQHPAKELDTLRGEAQEYAGKELTGICGRVCELSIDVEVHSAKQIVIHVAESENEFFSINYDVQRQILRIDRSNAGYFFGPEGVPEPKPYRDAILLANDGKIGFRIYMDRSSCEIFSKNGLLVMSNLICPKGGADGFSCTSDDRSAVFLVKAWEMIL